MKPSANRVRLSSSHGLLGLTLALVLTAAPLLTCCFSAGSRDNHQPTHQTIGAHTAHRAHHEAEHLHGAHEVTVETAPAHDDDCRCPPCLAATLTAPAPPDGTERGLDWPIDAVEAAPVPARARWPRSRPPATGPPRSAYLATVTPLVLHDRQLD